MDFQIRKIRMALLRHVEETMAPLRNIEEPRGSSGLKDPNRALLRDVEETVALLRSVEEPRGSSDLKDPNGAPP